MHFNIQPSVYILSCKPVFVENEHNESSIILYFDEVYTLKNGTIDTLIFSQIYIICMSAYYSY